jgi:hypothetical protein
MSKPFNEYLAAVVSQKEKFDAKGREFPLNDLYMSTLWNMHPDIACQRNEEVKGDEQSIVAFLEWVRQKMYEQQLSSTE